MQPQSLHDKKYGWCRAPGWQLVRAASRALAALDPPAAGALRAGARFLSYFVGFLYQNQEERKKEREKAVKIKTKNASRGLRAASGARVRVPPQAASSCSPSSPVGRCERGEQRERCEDARRWNNEFIAACHPAMAISTIRHCKLPLKGRASPTPPTLPGPRLIRRGRAGDGWGWGGGDRGKEDREGPGEVEGGTREGARARGKGAKSIGVRKTDFLGLI